MTKLANCGSRSSDSRGCNRCGTIDVIKFLAAVLVVAGHISEFGRAGESGVLDGMAVVVETFFVISGFFLMQHIDRLTDESQENVLDYLLRKVRTFFPALCIVNALHFIVYCCMNHITTVRGIAKKLWHFKWEFLLLQCAGMIPEPKFNEDFLMGQTWYLSAMMITLVLLYPLARYYRRALVSVICPLSILVTYAGFMRSYGTLNVGIGTLFGIPDSLVRAFAGQCCGILCYSVYRYIRSRHLESSRGYALLDIAGWAMMPLMVFLTFCGENDSAIFFLIPVCVVVTGAVMGTGPISGRLAGLPRRATDFLGKMSLYVYLTHWTALILAFVCLRDQSFGRKAVFTVLMTIAYSVMLYLLLERKTLRRKEA